MFELIIISRTRDHDCPNQTKKRLTELKKLKSYEIDKIIYKYSISKWNMVANFGPSLTGDDYINGIILHEKMLLGGKQTEILINIGNQTKSYFIKTISKFISVTKGNMPHFDRKEFYDIKFDLCSSDSRARVFCEENERFSCQKHILQINTNFYKDVEVCHRAIIFIESFYFYLKVKYLLDLFDGVFDIIRNICFVYFEKAPLNVSSNVSNLRCKFE